MLGAVRTFAVEDVFGGGNVILFIKDLAGRLHDGAEVEDEHD